MSGQLKEVRLRIQSVTSTQQITKAMKMVSAAKLRRAQDAILQMRPYTQKMQQMLSNIVSSLSDDMTLSLADERPVEKVLIIPITSDRGTCGAYNTNVIKAAKQLIADKYADKTVTMLPIGKKGFEYFQKYGYNLVSDYWTMFADLSFDNVKRAAIYAQEAFLNGEYDKVELVYSQFRNAATQVFVTEEYLPIPKVEKPAEQKETDFLFEPSKDILIAELMPRILNTQVYKAILDAHASEHGARMTAMDKATENANEILKNLKVSYNRARQAAITTELTEIVSGAAALQG
ncbi:MAG: ATP synthase F1 subunit gamma [Sphingobacteriales bacterium]|nr:MAG: ATP synthase F1 subunit gamma [Sphingobacteriales bacterium]